MQNIVLVGAGGCMRELLWQIQEYNKKNPTWNVLGYVDQTDKGEVKVGEQSYRYLGEDDWILQRKKQIAVVICIGASNLRQKIAQKYMQNECVSFPNLLLSETKICADVKMGKGCVIGMDAMISTNVKMGDFVFLNTRAMVCHDGRLDDFVTLSPGCVLAGNVHIGKATEVGMGANVIQGITIGANSKIGAGSVVIRNIPDNCTAAGIPASRIRGQETDGSYNYSRGRSKS